MLQEEDPIYTRQQILYLSIVYEYCLDEVSWKYGEHIVHAFITITVVAVLSDTKCSVILVSNKMNENLEVHVGVTGIAIQPSSHYKEVLASDSLYMITGSCDNLLCGHAPSS